MSLMKPQDDDYALPRLSSSSLTDHCEEMHHQSIEDGGNCIDNLGGVRGPSEGQVPRGSEQVPPEPHGYIPPPAFEAAHGLSPTELWVLHRTRMIKPHTMFR